MRILSILSILLCAVAACTAVYDARIMYSTGEIGSTVYIYIAYFAWSCMSEIFGFEVKLSNEKESEAEKGS